VGTNKSKFFGGMCICDPKMCPRCPRNHQGLRYLEVTTKIIRDYLHNVTSYLDYLVRTPDNTDEGCFQISGSLSGNELAWSLTRGLCLEVGNGSKMLQICLERWHPEASILHGIAPNSIRMWNT